MKNIQIFIQLSIVFIIIFLISTITYAESITLTLKYVEENMCNQTWIEQGIEINFGEKCNYGIHEGMLCLWPAILNFNLSSLNNRINHIEIDIENWCSGCTSAYIFKGATVIDTITCELSGSNTLILSNKMNKAIEKLTLSSGECGIKEIRIVMDKDANTIPLSERNALIDLYNQTGGG